VEKGRACTHMLKEEGKKRDDAAHSKSGYCLLVVKSGEGFARCSYNDRAVRNGTVWWK
jgi:hypothetical protein